MSEPEKPATAFVSTLYYIGTMIWIGVLYAMISRMSDRLDAICRAVQGCK